MNLQELYNHVISDLPVSTHKDLNTAIKILAHTLGYDTPDRCPQTTYLKPLPELYHRLETHLRAQGKGHHSIRNCKNNISRLLRSAEAKQLLTLAPIIPTPRFDPSQRPHRLGYSSHHPSRLPYHQWPSPLQEYFVAFATWSTAPVVANRNATQRKRLVTIEGYKVLLEGFFGYLTHIRHFTDLHFDLIFDYQLLHEYTMWHINKKLNRTSRQILRTINFIITLAYQYRPNPELVEQLKALRRTLPKPNPVYNKEDAWVSITEIKGISVSLWPKVTPKEILQRQLKLGLHKDKIDRAGVDSALYAGLSLMLRLWTFIPYRQRNIREMLLDSNLYKNSQGQWYIRFVGEELKVAYKNGKVNIFVLPFPPPITSVLEDYLQTWRPILANLKHNQYQNVFLNRKGMPFKPRALTRITKYSVYRYTGKHWHPHIIRSVWATEWIRDTHGDFYTAAVMLNDRLETVIANYAYLLEENVAEKAYRFIEERTN